MRLLSRRRRRGPERPLPVDPAAVRYEDWTMGPSMFGWGSEFEAHPDIHIIGPDGGPMIWVPEGGLRRGSPEGEGDADEHPQHIVLITTGFWLGKYPVTNGQYRAFCNLTGRPFPEQSRNGPLHPVIGVSWEDAVAYCEHFGLSLLTEAQWEYAARGKMYPRYPWGNEWDARKCCNASNQGTGDPPTMEVGSLPAGESWCGASDMVGNVWEWCADWYDEGYYARSPEEDPTGPRSGEHRVLRGGSWLLDRECERSAVRHSMAPLGRAYDVGFRVAIALPNSRRAVLEAMRDAIASEPTGEQSHTGPPHACPEAEPVDAHSRSVSRRIVSAPIFSSDWEVRPSACGWGPDSVLHPDCHIIGPDGGVMVWVPPGEFTMGSADDDREASYDERPAHRVRITKGFWLGKCEVTNAQYAKFLNEYGKLKDGQWEELIDLRSSYCGVEAVGNGFRAKPGRERHPVMEVSWYGAKAYCDYYGLSLPTEAQWEYAARGPEGRRYPWGNAWDASKCCNGHNPGAGYPATMEVGSLPAGNSWCGAADLAGNVEEWCADWYDEGYYARSPAEDPTGPTSGQGRLLRGGSWLYSPDFCRSAYRNCFLPESGLGGRGFRVARTP